MSASNETPPSDAVATAAAAAAAPSPPSVREKPADGGIPWATWPEACPSPHSDIFFSIACGNSHYHWAMHEGAKFRYVPHTFWKTCVLKDEDIEKSLEPCRELKVHLPDRASEFIFGPPRYMEENDTSVLFATQQHAVEASVSRRMPVASVYVISTNAEHERGLQYLFSKVPCRLFKLRASDFWKVGLYPTIGVDRVAALRGAQSCFGLPALVIDGGTAMTYTAANGDGQLMGGDISPGLAWRIKALHRCIAKVGGKPLLQLQDVDEILARGKPLECFSTDSKECVLSCALMDIGYKCYHVVKTWLREVGPATAPMDIDQEEKEEKDDGTKQEKKIENNQHRAVTITGGDMETIAKLLESVQGKFHSGIITPEPGATLPAEGEFTVERFRGAIHYGIAQVMVEKSNEQAEQNEEQKSESDRLRIQILGLRVAMLESELEEESRRGSVVSVSQGRTIDDDWFLVHHDDGEDKNYNLIQIYDGLKHYLEYGEVASLEGGLTVAQRQYREQKKKQAKTSVEKLETATEKLKAHVAATRKPEEVAAAAAKRSASLGGAKKAVKVASTATKKRSASLDGTKKKSAEAPAGGAKKAKPAAVAKTTAAAAVSVDTNPTEAAAAAEETITSPPDTDMVEASTSVDPTPTKKKAAPTSSTIPSAASSKKRAAVSGTSTATPAPPAAAAAKKSKLAATATPSKKSSNKGAALVGKRVAKFFPAGLFFGTVYQFLPKTDEDDDDLWKIHYDDGDMEEYDILDMNEALDLYSERVDEDPQ